jgi:hypothetical protein
VDQCEAEALFLNSRPAEADYGKNWGCPHLLKLLKKDNDDMKEFCSSCYHLMLLFCYHF